MADQNSLYAVQNDSGAPYVMTFGGATPPGSGGTPQLAPVFGNGGPPLKIAFGNSAFFGTGGQEVFQQVDHGLGVIPVWVDIFPALASFSTFWGALAGQYQGANEFAFYVAAYTPPEAGQFGPGYEYFFNWIAVGVME